MNFLNLAQKTRQLCGYQGSGPSSVDTTGYDAIFLTLVHDVWIQIQTSKKHWKWLKDQKNFITVIGQTDYTIPYIFGVSPRFRMWEPQNAFISVSGKKSPIRFVSYDVYNRRHLNDTENTVPREFTIRPQDSAIILQAPDAVYSLYIDYMKSSQELSVASDTPEMPVDFHNTIIYGAVAEYAADNVLPNLETEYNKKYSLMYNSLCRDQIPVKEFKINGIA